MDENRAKWLKNGRKIGQKWIKKLKTSLKISANGKIIIKKNHFLSDLFHILNSDQKHHFPIKKRPKRPFS
jgi:hypothetical protein